MSDRTLLDIQTDMAINIGKRSVILEILSDVNSVQHYSLFSKYETMMQQLKREYSTLSEQFNRSET